MRILLLALLAACAGEVAGDDAFDAEADGDDGEVDDLVGAKADGASLDGDRDRDGISDALEERLLRRYRPFYRWSRAAGADETFGPADPIAEIASSQLKVAFDTGTSDPIDGCGRAGDQHLDPPDSLLTCRSDTSLVVAGAKKNYCLNFDNSRYRGVTLAEAEDKAIGLYGHVAPTTIGGHAAYKIEYWQFFAFNNQDLKLLGLGSFGDHEGDWTSVQLWFDRELHRLVRVRYLIHGKEITFDIPATTPSCTKCTIDVRGSRFDPDPGNVLSNPRAYDNNAAQFYIDDNRYKHVVVYIERGGHEMWPGPWGHAQSSFGPLTFKLNSHNGDGPSYLVPVVTDRVLNLGEVDHPLTRAGRLILQFDGMWGCTNTKEVLGIAGPRRRSPVGPALHCSWTWPDGRTVPGCEG